MGDMPWVCTVMAHILMLAHRNFAQRGGVVGSTLSELTIAILGKGQTASERVVQEEAYRVSLSDMIAGVCVGELLR